MTNAACVGGIAITGTAGIEATQKQCLGVQPHFLNIGSAHTA
jgi:hypothetical protein